MPHPSRVIATTLWCGLLACMPKPSPDGAEKAASGFSASDLAVLHGGEITFLAIRDDQLVEVDRRRLAPTPDPEDFTSVVTGDWADREHFFAWIPPRSVVEITAGGLRPIEVPPPARFAAPRPHTDDDEGLVANDAVSAGDTGLVVGDGVATWAECPWGFPYDGWQCEVHVSAQLWPTPSLTTSPGGPRPRAWHWPEPPARARFTDEGVACDQHVFTGDPELGDRAGDFVFPAADRLVVLYGHDGLADFVPSRWTLHDGCKPEPLATGNSIAPGPAGLWLAARGEGEQARLEVRRGAEVIGELPAGAQVLFRPPPSR